MLALRFARSVRSTPLALKTLSSTSVRTFSATAITSAEGDTGSQRPGGAASGDAFTSREKASEDLYVRQQLQSKVDKLKKQTQEAEDQLAASDKQDKAGKA